MAVEYERNLVKVDRSAICDLHSVSQVNKVLI